LSRFLAVSSGYPPDPGNPITYSLCCAAMPSLFAVLRGHDAFSIAEWAAQIQIAEQHSVYGNVSTT
jgi:hypothetical protein